MPSTWALSTAALSALPRVTFVQPAIRRLATARVASQILFLEIAATERIATAYTDPFPERSGLGVAPLSSVPLSSTTLARNQRATTRFLYSTIPWVGFPSDPGRANERATPRVISAGRITRSIPVDATSQKRGQRNLGDVTLANPDGALNYLFTDYSIAGAEIKAWVAEPKASTLEWALLYQAVVESVEATATQIRIGLTTIMDELERPLQLRRYSGSGGISGDSNVRGRLKPYAIGECYGVAPLLISAADNIYAVSDGEIYSIDWVREGGLDYDFTSDYPDFDSLQAATLAAGEYATCLAYGLFRVGLNLEGLVYPLRVGLRGDASGSGYVSSTGSVLYRMARDRAFIAAEKLDVASFLGMPSGTIGYYYAGEEGFKVSDLFDRLLGGVAGYYGVGRGQVLTVGRITPAEDRLNTITLRADQTFSDKIEVRPDQRRREQPYAWAPTFGSVTSAEISSSADATTARRLQEEWQTATVSKDYIYGGAPTVQPTLYTYFANEESARNIALDALQISGPDRTPIRLDIGRLGFAVDLNGVVGAPDNRYVPNFRGIVYEQDDRLDTTVRSEVVALG